MNVKDHYDYHLGNFYSWMAGEFQENQLEQESFFSTNEIFPGRTKKAIDLGCGHGLQAVSLARLGFGVEAVDFNAQLISELKQNSGQLSIRIHQQEILDFLHGYNQSVDVITCMGDTITHLPDVAAVHSLVEQSFEKLVSGGALILSFRDLTNELTDEKRFIPIREDHEKVHVCFLEFFPDHVRVYDILHSLSGGKWSQKISWYPKLRISARQIEEVLIKNSFKDINCTTSKGMIYLIATK